jgi:very-short-patch-repair endonuclease
MLADMREGQNFRRARDLRKAPTDAERLLWRHLRGKQIAGKRFRRQVPIGPYFADFACLEAMLIVEVDGGQHNVRGRDEHRDRFFRLAGLKVLRVWNSDLMKDPASVCEELLSLLCARAAPTLALPRKRGRE